MTDADSGARAWWEWHLFGLWILVNGVAFVVIPLAGVAVEQLASLATRSLVQDHRALVVLIIAVIGAALQGLVVGSWQWRLLRRRVPDLKRRRWVMATLVPAFFVWLLAIAPEAADALAKGGRTLILFREGFIQALVLGPLIGLSQAAALRGHISRWAWWFAANVTTYRRRCGRGDNVVRARERSGAGALRVWLDRAPDPLTVDGLIYASSMVMLDSARRRTRAPALARWLLGLGVAATLAANVAHGLGHGMIGAAVGAWPAVALVGPYELLMTIIRGAQVSAGSGWPSGTEQQWKASSPLRRRRRIRRVAR